MWTVQGLSCQVLLFYVIMLAAIVFRSHTMYRIRCIAYDLLHTIDCIRSIVDRMRTSKIGSDFRRTPTVLPFWDLNHTKKQHAFFSNPLIWKVVQQQYNHSVAGADGIAQNV